MTDTPDGTPVGVQESTVRDDELPITHRHVLAAMGGGLVGTVLMAPLLVGVPMLFDVFRAEPLLEFAGVGLFFGVEPTLVLGAALFVFGGTALLPFQFLVVGAFLPPETPRYGRGVTFATLYWVGFLVAFWPGGGPLTTTLFVLVSLVAHWVYGAVLGFALETTIQIPQHEV
jgi:hypothetical protein